LQTQKFNSRVRQKVNTGFMVRAATPENSPDMQRSGSAGPETGQTQAYDKSRRIRSAFNCSPSP
jgi:hypothetical protein